jgi:hypothetical protein
VSLLLLSQGIAGCDAGSWLSVFKPIEYASFIVRIWRQSGLDANGNPFDWQSEVEHIQSGETWSFSTLEELKAFSRQQVEFPERLARLELPPDT